MPERFSPIRKFLLRFLAVLIPAGLAAQDTEEGSGEKHDFRFSSFGLYGAKGRCLYFDSYTFDVMKANSLAGLPLYEDWPSFSPFVTSPGYSHIAGFVSLADPSRSTELRLSGNYYTRRDSILYTGSLSAGDTIYVRTGSEKSSFGALSIALRKPTRRFAGERIRLFGGAEAMFAFTPSSKIFFLEYDFDAGESRVISSNVFPAKGRPRLNVYATANLGAEFLFNEKFALFAEVRSGIGLHLISRNAPRGISKYELAGGFSWYIRNY